MTQSAHPMPPAATWRLTPLLLAWVISGTAPIAARSQAPQLTQMQGIGSFEIDRTEVRIGEFAAYVLATGAVTEAERLGGHTYEGGWQRRVGWHWRAPFGTPGSPQEPAVHVTHAEAAAFCRWSGKRLPTDREWGEAAYTERRAEPAAPFVRGRTYPYPTGERPSGANFLEGCGQVPTVAHAVTSRGRGHAEVALGAPGVNGLYDMGGNVWEWVADGPGPEQRTRGGSWWYGPESMRNDHVQTKPATMSAVYIGFRCARDVKR